MPARSRSASNTRKKQTKNKNKKPSSSANDDDDDATSTLRHSVSPSPDAIAANDAQSRRQLMLVNIYGSLQNIPVADEDGYCRYRNGRVTHSTFLSNVSLNTFFTLPLLLIGTGLGSFQMAFCSVFDKAGINAWLDWSNYYHVALVMFVSGCLTAIAYNAACESLNKHFYRDEKMKKRAKEWKCRPDQWLSDDLEQLEVKLGCFNAAIGAAVGMLFFSLRLNNNIELSSPLKPKIYFSMDGSDDSRFTHLTTFGGGWPWYFASFLIFFVVTDLWAFVSHGIILHSEWAYKNIHYIHHKFNPPTAHSAYAMHPVEFIIISIGFQLFAFILPIHISALIINLMYLGWHSTIEHSGIDFHKIFWLLPSTAYHDDHHAHFHCNFGQSLVLWDWMFGTLKKEKRNYAENTFAWGRKD